MDSSHTVKFIFDIGNTRTKIAVFENGNMLELRNVKGNFMNEANRVFALFGRPFSVMVSTVSLPEKEVIAMLSAIYDGKILFFRSGMKLPVRNGYKTPQTLGQDRIANACAAWKFNPDKHTLVIDLGTCIKYDFVDETSLYHGGAIAPGLAMRYKALTRFTGQLPYFKPIDEFPDLIGQSTESSIRSGVENGILFELKGAIEAYRQQFGGTSVILTGGDHPKFADKLKSPIFVAPNLTLNGLKVILDANDL